MGLPNNYSAQPRASLRKLLATFKAKVRAAIDVYISPVDKIFFRPSKVGTLRLNILGVSNHVATITGLPHLPSDRATQITKFIISIRHSFTRNSSKLFDQGLLELKCQRISYRGVPKWHPLDTIFADCDVSEIRIWLDQVQSDDVPIFQSFLVFCPLCRCQKDVRQISLFKTPKWSGLLCNFHHCRKPAAS